METKKRGRPKGPVKVFFARRLTPEQKLRVEEFLDGPVVDNVKDKLVEENQGLLDHVAALQLELAESRMESQDEKFLRLKYEYDKLVAYVKNLQSDGS